MWGIASALPVFLFITLLGGAAAKESTRVNDGGESATQSRVIRSR